MACRIELRVVGEDLLMLCISGRITEEDVEMLRPMLDRREGVVAIDLKDVHIVAREAITFLALHELSGIELRNCPPYIREWVTKETADRKRVLDRAKQTEDGEDA
jgi:hypothetical protein